MAGNNQAKWWQRATFYEILVASFQDSNGDGFGDLPGITSRLTYLRDLGVKAVWLSPIFQSPMFDMGYDVSDFMRINAVYGTLDDYLRLLDEAHELDLRVIIDFVPNHTSNEHAWFVQSRRDRTNRYRDYYIWHDPARDGGAPNNWINRFGRTAWTNDEATGQYYFGTFAPEQPDLNWRNASVREEIFGALRYWLELGTDGVRVDALAHLVKDIALRNNPRNPDYESKQDPSNKVLPVYSQNQPELLEIIEQFKNTISEFPDRVFVGEVFQPPEQISSYSRAGADLLLNMSLFQVDFEHDRLQATIDRVEATTPKDAWPSRAAGDHDLPRLANRIGTKNLRLAAVLHFTLRGTPTMYYGDELGLEDIHVPVDRMMDPSGKDDPKHSRDFQRCPMPWNDAAHAGFSTVEPWLPLPVNMSVMNVQAQWNDPHSLLSFHRRLLELRNREVLLQAGSYRPLDAPGTVMAYLRHHSDDQTNIGIMVAINFGRHPVPVKPADFNVPGFELLLSTQDDSSSGSPEIIHLQPREAVIVRFT